MRVKANGIDIHYELDGPADAPRLMFSNPLATDLAMWVPGAGHICNVERPDLFNRAVDEFLRS